MQAAMPNSNDEPIVCDLMALTNVESRFYHVPHHDAFLDNSTPIYDPVSISTGEGLLTAIQYL